MSNNNEMKQLGYYLAGLIEGDGNIWLKMIGLTCK